MKDERLKMKNERLKIKDRGSQPKDARGIGLEQFAKKMPKDGCKEDAGGIRQWQSARKK
jgi:hypothetical protein